GSGYFARLSLGPVAVSVIEDSATTSDLLTVAVQFRKQFRKLREWIGEFQRAIDTEDVTELAKRKKLFESVVKNIDSLTSRSSDGETSIQVGLNWLKFVTKSGSPLNSIQNRFGVRAAMNRLILTAPGAGAFRKLLTLFGEENSNHGR